MSAPRIQAAVVGLWMLAACGGPEGPPIDIALSQASLDARLRTVRVEMFAGEQSCDVIEFSGPTVNGIYEVTVTLTGDGAASSGEINSIVPDVYTVVAWGFDADGVALQFDCTDPAIEVFDATRAEVTLTLRDYSGG